MYPRRMTYMRSLMNKFFLSLPIAGALLLAGCGDNNSTNQVISKRYIHKYGYAVSKSEWEANNYPGQLITTLRSGVTITSTYENGVLHGPTTHTHPHSQTVQYFYLYDFGDLKKEVIYDALGMPIREKAQLSPHRYALTMWYGDGTPMSLEDYADDELIEGKYLSLSNEVESTVERGIGLRTRRDQHGVLLSKDYFDAGYLVKQETFYPTGALEEVALYRMNKKHGEREVFAQNGDSVATEEWLDGELHGKATYFANGKKQTEVFFLKGERNGLEIHYVDGALVEKEILWNGDHRHGPTKFFVSDGLAKTEWYYNGKLVSKRRYDDLLQMENMVTQASTEFNESSPQ